MENIKDLEKEIDYKDQYIRLYAEFENYKKRAQKEKDELVLTTKQKSLSSILELDNDLFIATKNNESEGLTLIVNKVKSFLKSQGIEEIQTETYDSDLHEVISLSNTGESGKIVDVVSKGYLINDKPFKYPKIILSN